MLNSLRFIALAILLFPATSIAARQGDSALPDIIVILTDDMRADDWRILRETERLVGGTWFPNFVYTTPLCCPTRATIQRGQYAHNTGITTNAEGAAFRELDDYTIATALDAVRYHTIYVGNYMNGYGTEPAPGWDVWDTETDIGGKEKYWISGEYMTDVFRDRAVRAIEGSPPGQPMFMMVGFRAPHSPWAPAPRHAQAAVEPTKNDDDADRKRTLLSVDEAVVAIARAMGAMWNDACVFVLSDNGSLLGEHETSGKSHGGTKPVAYLCGRDARACERT